MPIELPRQHASPVYPVAAVLLAVGIFAFDTLSPLGIAIAVLYGLVVILGAQFLERRGVLVVAAICVLLTLVSFLVGHIETFATDAVIRCAVSLSAIVLTTLLALRNLEAVGDLRRQAALLGLTHDAIFVRDAHGTIVYWNRGAEALYGWPAAAAVGRNAAELLATESALPDGEVQAQLERAGAWTGELRRRKRDGTVMTVISRWSLHRDVRGQPAATMETSNDITDRKRADERVREAEQELRRVVDTIPGMVWSSSPEDGSIVYVNARWADLGWTFDDMRGSGWRDIAHPDDLPELEEDWARSLATGRFFEHVARLRQAGGAYRWTFLRAAPLRDDGGRILRWYGIAGDIEDRRRAEDALLRAQAELSHMARITTLGELTASIAHEVNQPLAAVVTNGEAALRWLLRSPPNLEAVRTSLEKMIANGRRASDVIVRLRALARRSEPDYVRLDLNGVVDETLLLVQREIGRHRIKLDLALDPSSPGVRGDRVQLQQVIINLVVNAIQAMDGLEEPARRLRIRTGRATHEDGAKAVLDVADSGVGIDGAEAGRLFAPFYSTKRDGMGMGLSICRSIVEAHQGRIAASRNPEAGATFTIWLPALTGERG